MDFDAPHGKPFWRPIENTEGECLTVIVELTKVPIEQVAALLLERQGYHKSNVHLERTGLNISCAVDMANADQELQRLQDLTGFVVLTDRRPGAAAFVPGTV